MQHYAVKKKGCIDKKLWEYLLLKPTFWQCFKESGIIFQCNRCHCSTDFRVFYKCQHALKISIQHFNSYSIKLVQNNTEFIKCITCVTVHVKNGKWKYSVLLFDISISTLSSTCQVLECVIFTCSASLEMKDCLRGPLHGYPAGACGSSPTHSHM